MGGIRHHRSCGVGCSIGCSTFMVIFAFCYAISCLAYTLVMRLYLKAGYNSAHMAALSIVLALFVFSHHTMYKCMRWMLNLSEWGFYLLHSVLNTVYLVLSLALAASLSVLLSMAVPGTLSWDAVTCVVLGWMDALLLLYLLVLTAATAAKGHEEYQLSEGGFMNSNDPIIAYESADGINMQNFNDTMGRKKKSRTKRCCTLQCCCSALVWPFYFLFHLLFIFFVSFSVYHVCGTAHDIYTYRVKANMYVVEVENHRPIAMYLECFGNGSETVLYENGFGVTTWLSKPFVPAVLAENQTVCVYDRRGYGWSETVESDYLDANLKDPQRAKTNVDFLKALVDKANITKPFFYLGYSYGGHHAIYMTLKYPAYVKGLIFLDSSSFGFDYTNADYIFEIVANFRATGLLRLVIDHNLYDLASAFRGTINLDELSDIQRKQAYATINSGPFFETYVREWEQLRGSRGSRTAQKEIDKDFQGKIINYPALVINAGSRAWFPSNQFPKFNTSVDLHTFPLASHADVALTNKYSRPVARIIDEFINRNS